MPDRYENSCSKVERSLPIDNRIKSNKYNDYGWIISILHSLRREKELSFQSWVNLIDSLSRR